MSVMSTLPLRNEASLQSAVALQYPEFILW
ncbi:hypothetical protein M2277_000283 [Paenibacillus sp. LBL]|nr:hypothetical protein [Paenibacillus sp. LBL]